MKLTLKLLFSNFWKNYQTLEGYLFSRCDSSSLAVFRISYGILMALDVLYERELSGIDIKWSNPDICYFPLIHSIKPLPYNWMCIVYLCMWLGTFGIALGYRFRFSCSLFLITYWYIVLLDKGAWNNHTYFFGLLGFLLLFTNAHICWSVDRIRKKMSTKSVPCWNYFILRFQIFLLYFMAGIKKINLDWLRGYSMTNLSQHWVFDPFKFCLSEEQIAFWIVHWGGFVIDISAGFGLCFSKTRSFTVFILFLFHFMNSRMFYIGKVLIGLNQV